MKQIIISFLASTSVLLATAFAAPDTDFAGKTVTIKTTKEGSTCIRIEKSVPKIGPFNKSAPESCLFKVSAGETPGTVCFESVAEPGLFLHNSGHHLALIKGTGNDGTFRIVAALRGSQGVALQSYSYPQFHVFVTDKDHIDFARDIKEPRKSTFHIQEHTSP